MFTIRYFHIPRLLSRKYVERVLGSLEKVIKKPQKGIIHLIMIDESTMTQMNEQFRGKTGPTDILTFSYYDKKNTSKDIAGEIYLYEKKIQTYAMERGHTYQEELEHIIIHGFVHLMGYDHETEEEQEEMEKIEKEIEKRSINIYST